MGKIRIKIDSQDYETDINHKDNIFAVNARHKAETINNLRTYVYNECNKSWKQLPKHIATMKRRYLQELCDALTKMK